MKLMIEMRRSLSNSIVGLVILTAVPYGAVRSSDAETIDAVVASIERHVLQSMNQYSLPGVAVAVVQDGEIVHASGYGEAVLFGPPVSVDTQFHIASVSKSITAFAVLQLVEAGLIKLDDPVVNYLPEFMTADQRHSQSVTIRHLLNQTSGLSYDGMTIPDEQPKTLEELTALMADVRPIADPGAEFAYFDPNYGVVARMVEVVVGYPFEDYLERNVFNPIGMRSSFAVLTADEAREQARELAQGYRLEPDGGEPVVEHGYLGGSGGVVSTIHDMALYLAMYQRSGLGEGRRLLSPQGLATLLTPPADVPSPYAMGWAVLEPQASPYVVESWGDLTSFRAELLLIPDTNIGAVLLYNATANTSTFQSIRDQIVEILAQFTPASDD